MCSFWCPGFLGIKISWKDNLYYVFNVYFACDLTLKCLLWNNILVLKIKYSNGIWVLGGNFNAVKNGGERVGRTTVGNSLEWNEFSCFIKDIGLVDIPCKGKSFSWFNGDGNLKFVLIVFLCLIIS